MDPLTYLANATYVGFPEMAGQLGSAIIVIPLIAILESVAIAKAFGEQYDEKLLRKLPIYIGNPSTSFEAILFS